MTIFYDQQYAIHSFKWDYKLDMSAQFIICADNQLTELFIIQTGIKPGKQVSLICSLDVKVKYKPEEIYVKGKISGFPIDLHVNHNWNLITVLWESKSGRIYDINDTDIDCSDIHFWFEGLNPWLYHKQLYPKDELPFKLKDLSFELVVTRLNLNCDIVMEVKPEETSNFHSIINQIADFINDFNTISMKNDRKDGVVHNASATLKNDKTITYTLDLGSAGFTFMKKLLQFMSKMNCFRKVVFE